MLLTGRTLFHITGRLQGMPTWPEAFARAGYDTFMTGKWHNGQESAVQDLQQGQVGLLRRHGRSLQAAVAGHVAGNTRLSTKQDQRRTLRQGLRRRRRRVPSRSTRADKPFLCYVAFNFPHDPARAPQSYHDHYNANQPPAAGELPAPAPVRQRRAWSSATKQLAPWPRTPEIVRQHLADYYAAIDFLDAQIGRILDALARAASTRTPSIVFASDHGLAIGSHGLFGKQNLYDTAMHPPLIMAGPGIPRGRQSDALCYLLDIFPTLGRARKSAAPGGFRGNQPRTGTQRRAADNADVDLHGVHEAQCAVRDDRWKLIVYPLINKTQLFDLRSDPLEIRDLAGRGRIPGKSNA